MKMGLTFEVLPGLRYRGVHADIGGHPQEVLRFDQRAHTVRDVTVHIAYDILCEGSFEFYAKS